MFVKSLWCTVYWTYKCNLDLHLQLPHLKKKLMWFNDNLFPYIFQSSDDGVPETSQLNMFIGSLGVLIFIALFRQE